MDIEQRLATLERQNRWLKIGLAVVGCVVVFAGAADQKTAVLDSVTTRLLTVVNQDGAKVAMIKPIEGGCDLAVFCTRPAGGGSLLRTTDRGPSILVSANSRGDEAISLAVGEGKSEMLCMMKDATCSATAAPDDAKVSVTGGVGTGAKITSGGGHASVGVAKGDGSASVCTAGGGFELLFANQATNRGQKVGVDKDWKFFSAKPAGKSKD